MSIAKLALNRFHKEILRKLTGHVPDEAIQAVRRGKKTLPSVWDSAPLTTKKGVVDWYKRNAGNVKGTDRHSRLSERGLFLRSHLSDTKHRARYLGDDVLNRGSSRLRQADERALRTLRYTGKAKVRPGETFLPSAGGAEYVLNPHTPRGPLLYRGNDLVGGGRGAHLTRHPDVAAGYATGRTNAWQPTEPSGVLHAFRRKDLKISREQPADLLPLHDVPTEKVLAKKYLKYLGGKKRARLSKAMRNKSRSNVPGEEVPTYETVLHDTPGTRKKTPTPVASYRTRMSHKDGVPGYALERITR